MDYIKLMRPKHYIKNFLIFLPLIFSGNLLNIEQWILSMLGFVCFSLAASCVYVINDIKDKNKDFKHDSKRNRPIAAGKIKVKNAIIFEFILLTILTIIIIISKMPLLSIILLFLYYIINIGYSFGLKNIPILDVIILMLGFLIRVLFGASILSINVSNYLYLTVMSASFYLGFGKRRNEIVEHGSKTRSVLKYYTKDFLDKNMYMFLSMTIIFYSLWAIDLSESSGRMLTLTIPIVVIICMKYNLNIEIGKSADPVEVIWNDSVILLLGLLLGVCLLIILYL